MSLVSELSVPIAMGWRDVLFANWPVDPDVVAAHVPDRLDVETYDGDAWLTVLPFVNVAVRPRGLPSALGIRLPELNLRTYVRAGDNPGIYFFTLDAEGVLSVLGARATHHLPYHYARMRTSGTREERADRASDGVSFRSARRHPGARPCRFAATYRPTGERFRAERGSLARFLTERHLLFTEDPWGRLRYTRARHSPWPLYDADVALERNELFEAHGFDDPERDPVHYYSPGVDTRTSRSHVLDDASRDLLGNEPRT